MVVRLAICMTAKRVLVIIDVIINGGHVDVFSMSVNGVMNRINSDGTTKD